MKVPSGGALEMRLRWLIQWSFWFERAVLCMQCTFGTEHAPVVRIVAGLEIISVCVDLWVLSTWLL